MPLHAASRRELCCSLSGLWSQAGANRHLVRGRYPKGHRPRDCRKPSCGATFQAYEMGLPALLSVNAQAHRVSRNRCKHCRAHLAVNLHGPAFSSSQRPSYLFTRSFVALSCNPNSLLGVVSISDSRPKTVKNEFCIMGFLLRYLYSNCTYIKLV